MTHDKDGRDNSGDKKNNDAGRPREDRPRRPYDDKPRSFGDKSPRAFGDKPSRPYGDRPARPSGDRPARPFGDKSPRAFGDKPRDFNRDNARDDRAPRPFDVSQPDEGERIAKRLARVGIASRREAETMIAAGRVAVNGKVLTSPAVNVLRTDKITVDNKVLQQAERTRLWLYHKPSGLVTTNRDPEGRSTVFDALPEELPRVLSVGRLDINTEGLLLLTNDGGLSRVLELPATGWLRRYRVRAHGTVTQAQLDELKNGIAVDGVFYGSIEAQLEREQGSNVWLTIGLREGKNREVKNVLGALGLVVSRLIRVSFGPFQLGDLEEGSVREIRGRTLRDQLGEKLIADSGADFDSPIYNEFSNQSVAGELPRRESRFDAHDERGSRDEGRFDARSEERPVRRSSEWISSTGTADAGRGGRGGKSFGKPGGFNKGGDRDKPFRRDKPDNMDRRDESLSRWSTSAPKGDRFSKGGGDKFGDKSAPVAPRPRGVNVWMAPGAKAYNSKPFAKSSDGDERPRRSRTEGEGGSRDFNRGPRREGDAGPRREDGERNFRDRSDRPREDRPRSDRPRSDAPRSDRPHGDRPRDGGFKKEGFRPERRGDGDRPAFGDRAPRSDRPAHGDKPFRGERPAHGDRAPRGDRPARSERPAGDDRRSRPQEGRSFDKSGPRDGGSAGRPSGNRPSGDRPAGNRPSGDRPTGNRPSGDRPTGNRPSGGGRPSGRPGNGKR